jgi:SP family myo-inositol transporter-like MFS transporter 13
MTLEEVRQVFEHGFGVKYAEEWRKEYKRGEKARGPSDHVAKV